jgi:hypothetical protein
MIATGRWGARLGPAALVAVLALAACSRSSIVGNWSGRDESGASVVYSFASDGTGYRMVGGAREELTYEMSVGYPNLLRVTIGQPGSAQTREGLVELRSEGVMRLELGPPGGARPEQLTARALELRRPATR